MQEYTIRKATPNDLPIVKQLMLALYHSDRQYDALFYELHPEEHADEEYSSRIRGEDGVCYIAELEGEIIGCLTGALSVVPGEHPARRTRLEKVFVKERFRDLGVGSALVEAFVQWNKEIGVNRIFVRAYAENAGAIKLYERFGFRPYILGLLLATE